MMTSGPIAQLGFVVRDLDKALQHWVDFLGVGPFFVADEIKPDQFVHRGRSSDATFSAALANSGPTQIELIQPLGEHPSQWQEFLKAGREGLQHVAYWTEDFDVDFAAAQAKGHRVAHGGLLSGGRFVYFDADIADGYAIELSEQSPEKKAVFGAIREAGINWDGQDPIRPWAQALSAAGVPVRGGGS